MPDRSACARCRRRGLRRPSSPAQDPRQNDLSRALRHLGCGLGADGSQWAAIVSALTPSCATFHQRVVVGDDAANEAAARIPRLLVSAAAIRPPVKRLGKRNRQYLAPRLEKPVNRAGGRRGIAPENVAVQTALDLRHQRRPIIVSESAAEPAFAMIFTSTRKSCASTAILGFLGSAKELFDAMVDLRLAQADRVQRSRVDRLARAESLAQKGHDLLDEHRLHLAWYSGHARDELPVARERDEAWRGSVGVIEGTATPRELACLRWFGRIGRPTGREDPLHLPQGAGSYNSTSSSSASQTASFVRSSIVGPRPPVVTAPSARARTPRIAAAMRSRLSPTACVPRTSMPASASCRSTYGVLHQCRRVVRAESPYRRR